MPPAGHCSVSLSGGIAQTLLQLPSFPPCVLDHEHGPNVATKH